MSKLLFLVASHGQPTEAGKLQKMFDHLPMDYDLLFILDANNSQRDSYDEADVSYILDKNPTGNLADQLPKYADSFKDNYDGIFTIVKI